MRNGVFVALLIACVGAVASANVQSIDITTAVRLALEADIDYQIALLTWENAKIDDETARVGGETSPYARLQQNLSLRRAQHAFEQAHVNLVLGVAGDYVGLTQAERQLEIRQRQLGVAEEQMARVEEMVRIGHATEQDLLREQNQVTTARLNLATAERTYTNRRLEFVERLGLTGKAELELFDAPAVEPLDLSLDAALQLGRAASFDIWERQVNLQMAQMELENQRAQNLAPLALQKVENNHRIEELNAARADRQFQAQFEASYHSLRDAWLQLENAEREYLLAEATYRQSRRQFDAGLKTPLEMESAEIDRLSAELAVQSARGDYALQQMQFAASLGWALPYAGEALE